MRWVTTLFGVLCFLHAAASGVKASTPSLYESPVEQVSVLELYTSHGCSSCPPADAWLRRLADRSGLWNAFVPLAFHVDYWDDLGWTDRFASDAFSERQRAYFRSGRLSSVYTPGFVIRGQEWRGWFRGHEPELAPGDPVGRLLLEVRDGSGALIRFAPHESLSTDRFTAHLVIMGFGLKTDIRGGENRGRILQEDFVVLGYRSSGPPSSSREWHLALPETVPARTAQRAVVAWISTDADPAPLQAVGGWIPLESQSPDLR